MRIDVIVTLAQGDKWENTADEAAAKVMAALGAEPMTDVCVLTVALPQTTGQAGTMPDPTPAPGMMQS